MRTLLRLLSGLILTAAVPVFATAETTQEADAAMLRKIYDAALVEHAAYVNLQDLVARFPGRITGSKKLEGAVQWGKVALEKIGADRVELQPVTVPHWERGAPESVQIVGGAKLAAVALGGSEATPPTGITAPVVELHSLDELKTTDVKGKIVFFNRPANPKDVQPFTAYRGAGDQRNRGPAEAAKFGAVAVLVRSLTHAHDDVPHTGITGYLPDVPRLPAAALSTLAADKLSAALKADATLQVSITINSHQFEDAPSHNVIGELRGSEQPEKIILVGGHLDSWDIAPGAHDDGAGVVQSIDVLRILKAAGYTPRHTIRCVLFTSEENGAFGGIEYNRVSGGADHLLALESDNGGFDPRGFQLANTANNAAIRAARWKELFEPYGISLFRSGNGGSDVGPLATRGYAVGELITDSQRYLDIHHTVEDAIDKVNPRELELGAAAMAALVYLVDQHGL